MVHESMPFDKFIEGYYRGLGPRVDPDLAEIMKEDTRYNYTATPTYFNAAYSAKVSLEALSRSTTLYKLLRKTSYLSEGDSFHYISTDAHTGLLPILTAGAIFGADTSIPAITDVDFIVPAVHTLQWEDTLVARELSKIQAAPVTDAEFIRQYMTEVFTNNIDQALAGVYLDPDAATYGHGVDTPASYTAAAPGVATIECIDRMLTTKSEGGTATYVSADTDGDIFWGPTNKTGTDTARIDRSGSTAWDCQIRLPTGGSAAAGEAYNILDELDDLMATALTYAPSDGKNYIGLCSPKALNKIQNELDPKQRFLEGAADVTQTINGVSTRPGVEGGKVSVASLTICGVKVPFFTSPYLQGTSASSWLWKNAKHTTGGPGNIYLINMDGMEFRTLIPITYETWPSHTEVQPGLGNRHILYTAGQLLVRNWASHAKLAFIAS